MSKFSRFAYPKPFGRLAAGIGSSILVVAVAVIGLKPGQAELATETTTTTTVVTTIPATTPPTTIPPTTTTTTTTEPLVVPQEVPVELDPTLPCQQWIPLAVEVGWPNDEKVLTMLSRIMWRESRCRPEARSKSSDTGLLQVNDYWCKKSRYTSNPSGWLGDRMNLTACSDLTDPETNLRAGLLIWYYSLTKNGNGWHPWRFSGPTK